MMPDDQAENQEGLQQGKRTSLPEDSTPAVPTTVTYFDAAQMLQAEFVRQEQAETTRKLMATIIASSDDAIISKTLDGIITSWNQAAARLFGYSPQEAIGQHITLIIPPHLRQEEDEILARLRQGMHINHYETVRVTKDGRYIDVSLSISPLRDEQGTIFGAAKIARDISRQKAIARKLQEAEEQERFLTEVSKVLASTLDYQETLANIARLIVPRLADWFTVDLLDDGGHFQQVIVEHQDPEKVKWARALREQFPINYDASTGLPNVVRTGQSELYPEITDEMLVAGARSEEELEVARQIGYNSIMLVPLIARGKTIGVVTFVATESGKKYTGHDLALAEEVGRRAGVALDNARLYNEVRQARNQLEIILQGVADGIIVYDKDSRIIYANEAAAHMTGYGSVQELQQARPLEPTRRFELSDEHGKPFSINQLTHKRVLAGEREALATIGYTRKPGGRPERWSLVKSSPVYDEHGEVLFVITITHDITERVLAEHRKDEFISMASHELKTPVTSLKGFTYVLQRRLRRQGDEQGLHYLERMDAQLNKLTKLVSDLLDISRMQTGKLEFQRTTVDLDALIAETVENMQAASPDHHISIRGKAEVHVFGDKDRLSQVIINLLTNAVKYSPQADKVIVHVSQSGQCAVVRVQDFGIGIDEAHQQKIFERFYQVTDPDEKTYPGLGIGLHISKEIVELHQGRIEVQSRKGHGSTFSVFLPILQKQEEYAKQR
ncbi:MAG TPA: PAS domain S-box protein [Ktedonobacteraceae bacterium]|nr:PAS domain S-box protein [Ktedonobacteraceae bacterium]